MTIPRIKVVTSIVGEGRDRLKSNVPEEGVEFISYTNDEYKHWVRKPPCALFKEDRRNAKIHKILIDAYEDCDVSIWIDGNVALKRPAREIVENLLGDGDIAICRHADRNDLFEEAEYIKKIGVDAPETIDRQIEKYSAKKEEIIKEGNLYFASVIIRKHSHRMRGFNDRWWREIHEYSLRDQISLPYVLRQFPELDIRTFDFLTFRKYFYRAYHEPIMCN